MAYAVVGIDAKSCVFTNGNICKIIVPMLICVVGQLDFSRSYGYRSFRNADRSPIVGYVIILKRRLALAVLIGVLYIEINYVLGFDYALENRIIKNLDRVSDTKRELTVYGHYRDISRRMLTSVIHVYDIRR